MLNPDWYVDSFLKALGLTLLVELIVGLVLHYFFGRHLQIPRQRIVIAGVLASSLTLPYLWFVAPSFHDNSVWSISLAECIIVLIEAFIYTIALPVRFSKACILSFLCNAASVLAGLLWNFE